MGITRIVLKLSGEALRGRDEIFDPEIICRIAKEISDARAKDHEIAVVIGGGNVFRGATGESKGLDRTRSDHVGMLATLQNGILLTDMLERVFRVDTRLMTGVRVDRVAEPYIAQKAVRHLEKGRVIILAGGTGNPFFTTDTAAALRANEIKAGLIAKATNIDGVYDKDPRKHPDAKRLKRVSFDYCIENRLEVMDTAAFALCREHNVPIRVFSLREGGNIVAALTGQDIGSLVTADGV